MCMSLSIMEIVICNIIILLFFFSCTLFVRSLLLCVHTTFCFITIVRANPHRYYLSSSSKPTANILGDFPLGTCVRISLGPRVCVCIGSLGPLSGKALPIYIPTSHVWGILSSSFLPLIGINQLFSFLPVWRCKVPSRFNLHFFDY